MNLYLSICVLLSLYVCIYIYFLLLVQPCFSNCVINSTDQVIVFNYDQIFNQDPVLFHCVWALLTYLNWSMNELGMTN